MATMKLVPVAVALSLSACVISEVSEEEVAVVEQYAISSNCDEWGCGMNSPEVDSKGFHFLYKNGAQNPQGFAITSFTKGDGTPLAFNVSGGRITGTTSGGTVYGETSLIGSKIHISYYGTPMYRIRIGDYGSMHSWAKNSIGIGFRIKTYRFEWEDLDDPGKFYDMCSNPGADDTLGMNDHHTVVFEGDVIYADTKTVRSTANTNVVNFGCAGGTLAKLHLTAHTYVANAFGFTTTTGERQAMLKMLSGDYCGTGKAYTVGGQPLTWSDHNHWMQASAGAQREAHWTSAGASCLNTPRLAVTDPVAYEGLRTEILASCPRALSKCPSVAPVGTHLISAHPLLP
jgi:hypothetical protein